MIISVGTEKAFDKNKQSFIIKSNGETRDEGTIYQHNKGNI